MFCEFMFSQEGLNEERIDVFMMCFDGLLRMNFGGLLNPLFEKHIPELTSEQENPKKLEKYLEGMQYKEFLDDDLIVVAHNCLQLQQYLPVEFVTEKMI